MTTTDGQLPAALRHAIDELIEGTSGRALAAASDRLREVYRRDHGAAPALATTIDRLAYVAARLPATFAATRAVLAELRRRHPALAVASLLELGAGPAPAIWAARELFPDLARVSHVEANAGMADLGRALLARTGPAAAVPSTWHAHDLAGPPELPRHDLVLMAYVLGELSPEGRARALTAAWQATAEALVLVEPGTPAGAARVLEARAWLIEAGGSVVAPCPHAAPCPLPPDDWCHFAARLNRSRLQRRVKRAALAFEDEKYAYVAVTRRPAARCAARVLRRPELAPRRVTLRLCAADGLQVEQVTRGRSPSYRQARKARWGEAWSPAGGTAPGET